MLDYHAHAAALDSVRSELATLIATNPDVAARTDSLLQDAAAEEDALLLGGLVDHLIAHAASDGVELELLETAASLWGEGGVIYETVSRARADVEAALADPSAPDSVDRFNRGVAAVASLKGQATTLVDRSKELEAAVRPLPHLGPHPRQQDAAIQDWDWSNRFLARRTDAFTRAVFEHAGSPMARSFGLGALSSYASNATGAAYLGHTVGGPRRSHRYRNRVARNAIGSWVAANIGGPDLATMASRVSFGAPAGSRTLPPDITDALRAALTDAFASPSLPDLDLGLERLTRHLELLAVFTRPELPEPPLPELGDMIALSATGGDSLHPLTDDPYGTGDPQPTASGTDPTTADSKSSSSNVCVAIILVALIAVVLVIDCIVQLVDHGECDPGDTIDEIMEGDDEPEEVQNSGQLLVIASSPAGGTLVQQLFQVQMILWQAFDQAFSYLAITGLIYPDEPLLASPVYSQFTSIPNRPGWPRQLDPDAEEVYQAYPMTPTEQPGESASPFPAGAHPDSFLGVSPQSPATAGGLAAAVWSQVARGNLDANNLDLDADRGFKHPCWQVSPGTSINDQPLDVEQLAYNAM